MPAWRMPPRWVIFMLMLVAAMLIRFPYFFLSNYSRLWRYEMLYHDEALFLLQGRHVLAGHLPYIGHWDNRPAFGWFMFAILNFLSGENLVVFRVLGALYIGLTGFVLFRVLADRQKAMAGLFAGLAYIIFVSVAQVGQSITYEHVVALPFSLMLYVIFNPHHGKHPRIAVTVLFTMMVMMLTNYIIIGPAVALLMPPYKRDPSGPPPFVAWRQWLHGVGRWALAIVRNGLTLLFGLFVGYAALYTLYWINGEQDMLIRSMVDGAFAVSRQPLDDRFFTQMMVRWGGFGQRFLNSYIYSNEWLIPFMLTVFLARSCSMLFGDANKRDMVLVQLLVLLVFGSVALFFRGGNYWNFPYYLLQIMPLIGLIIGCAATLRMGDVKFLMLAVMVVGMMDATRMVLSNYRPLYDYAQGQARPDNPYIRDRQYLIAQVLNNYALAGQNMVLCNEDDMLYILTHTENPRFYLFTAFTQFYYLTSVLKVTIDPMVKTVQDSKPAAIVGWRGDECFSSLATELQKYRLVSTVQGTVVYVRKDLLPKEEIRLVPELLEDVVQPEP